MIWPSVLGWGASPLGNGKTALLVIVKERPWSPAKSMMTSARSAGARKSWREMGLAGGLRLAGRCSSTPGRPAEQAAIGAELEAARTGGTDAGVDQGNLKEAGVTAVDDAEAVGARLH